MKVTNVTESSIDMVSASQSLQGLLSALSKPVKRAYSFLILLNRKSFPLFSSQKASIQNPVEGPVAASLFLSMQSFAKGVGKSQKNHPRVCD